MLARRKTGPKPRNAVFNGETQDGLYVAYKPNGSVRNYYYLDEKGKQVSCTSDLATAMRRLAAFKSGLEGKQYGRVPKGQYKKCCVIEKSQQGRPALVDRVEVSDEYVIKRFVEIWASDHAGIARKTGIWQLAHLDEVKAIPHSATLAELLKIWVEGKHRNKVYVRDVRRYWGEFTKHIGKTDVRDITHEDVGSYKQMVHICSQKSEIQNSPRYVNNRFIAVRAVVHYAQKMTAYTKDIDQLAKDIRQLEEVTECAPKVRPVCREEMMKLFGGSAGNPLGRCLVLLGINCCLRHADIADLRKTDIDLAAMTMSKRRTKTNVVQSSMLWQETVDALKEYMKEFPNDTVYVFATRFGNKYPEKYLRAEFRRVREVAGLPSIKQKMLRSTGYRTATLRDISGEAKAIHMGWTHSKVANSYDDRPAEATKKLVDALHKDFFDPPDNATKK